MKRRTKYTAASLDALLVQDGTDGDPIAQLLTQAQRKAGAMLAEMELMDGGDAMKARSRDVTEVPPSLDDLGVTKMQSHRWQRFGDTYRVTHDESYAAERPEFRTDEEPWLQIIPGARGHVFPWSADRLAASTNTRGPVVKQLLAIPDVEVQQDGTDGITATFPVDRLSAVAEVLRLRRRRRLSPEARAKLAAVGTATRFQRSHGVGARENAPERARTGRSDTLTVRG
jgi:hypothetical protein